MAFILFGYVMNKLLMLERRISRLEKLIRNEAKQVGTLYHVCNLDSLNHILKTNTIE